MPECPTCNRWFDVDIELLNAHVASHYDEEASDPLTEAGPGESGTFEMRVDKSNSSAYKRKYPDDEVASRVDDQSGPPGQLKTHDMDVPECFVCGRSLEAFTGEERQVHVNGCLDSAGSSEDEQIVQDVAEADSRREEGLTQDKNTSTSLGGRLVQLGNSSWKAGDPRQSGDLWWSPADCSVNRLPPNFTPGLIPILKKILLAANSQGVTRRAVLCAEGVCHIKSSMGFDSGWGCGYRNLEMALTALLFSTPGYRPVFPSANPAGRADSPGVRNLQVWMQQAWDSGFDTQGRNQLQGKIVGTKKWIGTSDIYAAMVAKGVPCCLHDFPKPTGAKWHSTTTTHSALTAYVQKYFDEDVKYPDVEQQDKPKTAFDKLMDRQSSTAVRTSSKLPLILQHSGHSRTIVGYEINAQGSTNLLLFDPGSTIPKDIRRSAIERFELTNPPDEEYDEQEIDKSEPAAVTSAGADEVRSDEEVDGKGWVRKKVDQVKTKRRKKSKNKGKASEASDNNGKGKAEWEVKPVKALNAFRVNLGALSKNQEYQILRFTGAPLMTEEERKQYRLIRAERMT